MLGLQFSDSECEVVQCGAGFPQLAILCRDLRLRATAQTRLKKHVLVGHITHNLMRCLDECCKLLFVHGSPLGYENVRQAEHARQDHSTEQGKEQANECFEERAHVRPLSLWKILSI